MIADYLVIYWTIFLHYNLGSYNFNAWWCWINLEFFLVLLLLWLSLITSSSMVLKLYNGFIIIIIHRIVLIVRWAPNKTMYYLYVLFSNISECSFWRRNIFLTSLKKSFSIKLLNNLGLSVTSRLISTALQAANLQFDGVKHLRVQSILDEGKGSRTQDSEQKCGAAAKAKCDK